MSQHADCATCLYNEFNVCKGSHGYYAFGEVISEELVDCEEFEENPQSFGVVLR